MARPALRRVNVVETHRLHLDCCLDAAVIGQPLKLNQQSFTIIGVTPPGFIGTLQVSDRPAFTIPLAGEPLLRGVNSRLGTAKEPGAWWLDVMGRLKPGATYEQARVSLNSAFQAAALEVMPPPRRADEPAQLDPKGYPRLLAESGSRGMLDLRREYAPTIYGLFIVVALVLLIACANIANLLLARAATRIDVQSPSLSPTPRQANIPAVCCGRQTDTGIFPALRMLFD